MVMCLPKTRFSFTHLNLESRRVVSLDPALPSVAGFLCFCWLKHDEDEEKPYHSAEAFEGGVQHGGAVILLPVFGQPVAKRRRTRLNLNIFFLR
jgi:hypothetical protein